jgi:hypothetical protein
MVHIEPFLVQWFMPDYFADATGACYKKWADPTQEF